MPSSPDVSFEATSAADFETLVALRIEAMRESLERIGRFDPVRARERFRLGFSPAHTQHIVYAEQHVGFVVTTPLNDYLLLDHLYIRPGFQNLGIGSKVLKMVFQEAQIQGLPIKVGALKESDSNRFYQRHGFALVEQTEFDNYYLRPAHPQRS